LFHLPTVGRNQLSVADLDMTHLKMLNKTILEGQASHIFVSPAVARLMRASGLFPWLPLKPAETDEVLPVLFKNSDKTVYSLSHLSSYGKYQGKLDSQLKEVTKFLNILCM